MAANQEAQCPLYPANAYTQVVFVSLYDKFTCALGCASHIKLDISFEIFRPIWHHVNENIKMVKQLRNYNFVKQQKMVLRYGEWVPFSQIWR